MLTKRTSYLIKEVSLSQVFSVTTKNESHKEVHTCTTKYQFYVRNRKKTYESIQIERTVLS